MRDDVSTRVMATLAHTIKEYTGRDLPPLCGATALDDLAVGSLVFMEIVTALEEEFQIEIPEEGLAEARTVEDIVSVVIGRLRAARRVRSGGPHGP